MRSKIDITLADLLRDDAPATISVPTAARLLGICRTSGYRAAGRGEIPTIRVGRSLRVPVPQFLAMLATAATVAESDSEDTERTGGEAEGVVPIAGFTPSIAVR